MYKKESIMRTTFYIESESCTKYVFLTLSKKLVFKNFVKYSEYIFNKYGVEMYYNDSILLTQNKEQNYSLFSERFLEQDLHENKNVNKNTNSTKKEQILKYCEEQINKGFIPSLWLNIEDYECALERLEIQTHRTKQEVKDFLYNVDLWDFDNFVYYVEDFERKKE